MKKVILLGLFSVIFSFIFGQETKTISKNGISLDFPKDWVVTDVQGYLILVNESAKEELTIMSTFEVQLIENFTTTKDFYDNYKKEMKSSEIYQDFKVKSKYDLEFKGYKAIEYNCTATYQYIPVEWRSVIFIKDGKLYKLTTTSMIGKYYLLQDKMNKIFESFRFE